MQTQENSQTEEQTTVNESEVAKAATPEKQEKTDLNKIIEFLATKFPASFSVKGQAKVLKIGIFNDIAERLEESDQVSKTQVRHALRRYTNSWRYLEAVVKGGQRVDLDGNDVEALTEEHISHATTQLAESKAKFQEKRKAQKPQNKNGQKRSQAKTANLPKRKPKTNKPTTKPAPVEKKDLVANDDFSAGNKVLVSLGASPVAATILETSKSDVSVQLSSGMVMKVSKDSIYKA